MGPEAAWRALANPGERLISTHMLDPRAVRAGVPPSIRPKPYMAQPLRRKAELEKALDAITRSYEGPLEVNNLESAALPNRRAVIEAYSHLVPAIYMGFYSRRGLCLENLRDSIAEHLYPAFTGFVEQIDRASSYEEGLGRGASPHSPDRAEAVMLRLFERIPELRRVLNTDVLAAYEGDPAAKSIEEIVFSYPAIRAITAYRIAHVLYTEGVPMIPRILSEHAHSETGIDINAGAIVDGKETIQDVGRRIFDVIRRVASGERTKSEILGHKEFVPWRIGPVM